MSQDNKDTAVKKNGQMTAISLISVLTVLLFIIEIYEIINDQTNLIAIGALGVFILATVYAQMHLIGRMIKKRQAEQEEAFNNVYRSEKASYLLMRKYFDQMEERMDSFNSQISAPYKEMIAAQKALAKVQINRSKQNANTLLISNDKMLHKISDFQKQIANNNVGLSDEDKAALLESNKDLLSKQQEILSALQELETSLKSDIIESVNKVESLQSQLVTLTESIESAEEKSQLQSLDIEHEHLMDNGINLRQPLETSSESDLDQLLKGIDNKDSAIPELEPIMAETELEPMTAEPELGSIMAEPELEPIMTEPELAAAEPELGSIMGEPELGSIMAETELEPVTAEPELGSIMEEPELEPIMTEPELGSIMEEPQLDSIVAEPELEPIMGEPELRSIAEESELKSMEDMQLESVLTEPELEPIVDAAESVSAVDSADDSMPDMELNDLISTDEIAAMISNVDMNENEEEPELKPAMKEPQLHPIMTESDLEAMLNNLDNNPMSAVQTTMKKSASQGLSKKKAEPAKDRKETKEVGETKETTESIKDQVDPDADLEKEAEQTDTPDMTYPGHGKMPEHIRAMIANLGTDQDSDASTDTNINTDSNKNIDIDKKTDSNNDIEKIQSDTITNQTALEPELNVLVKESQKEEGNAAQGQINQTEGQKSAGQQQPVLNIEAEQSGTKITADEQPILKESAETMQQAEEPGPKTLAQAQAVLKETAVSEQPDMKVSAESQDLHAVTEPKQQEMKNAAGMQPILKNAEPQNSAVQPEPVQEALPKPEAKLHEELSTEDELDEIMKALDIDDLMDDTTEEDLDIDKILEIPLSEMKSNNKKSTSNFDQVMNSDEIAALIANTDLLSEPDSSNNDDGLPDLTDPGYVMSSDEIAALIANL